MLAGGMRGLRGLCASVDDSRHAPSSGTAWPPETIRAGASAEHARWPLPDAAGIGGIAIREQGILVPREVQHLARA